MPTDFFGRVMVVFNRYGMSMLQGAGVSLKIALVGTLVGCIIGFAVGIVQTIPSERGDNPVKRAVLWAVKLILNAYVEFFRGTPMMAQAMFIYYGLLPMLGINMSMWGAAYFILSINTGAYMAETVRGGILSIDPGQTEGAKAIGMTHVQAAAHHRGRLLQEPDSAVHHAGSQHCGHYCPFYPFLCHRGAEGGLCAYGQGQRPAGKDGYLEACVP